MRKLLSYHGDPKVKAKYVERALGHQKADEIVRGVGYWTGAKGCAIGCLIHGSDHSKFPTEDGPGWPEWLARLVDTLFEGLPVERSKKFPVEVCEAIPVGVDLQPVEWKFTAMLMERLIPVVQGLGGITPKLNKQVVDALEGTAAVNRDAIKSGRMDEAARAAWAARAASAEWAAWAASAASAAWAARAASAASAARAASAEWAASAASAAYVHYSDALLGFLKSEGK